jgi:quercetin dioxygenase-like cupin family protein
MKHRQTLVLACDSVVERSERVENGATIVGAGSGPTHRSPFGDSLRWITGDEATRGAYSLHERTAPAGAASVTHIHSSLIEAFYVLEGEFTFELDGRTITAAPGDYVHAPAGAPHAWRVTSEKAARALVLFTPSVPLAFFEEIDAAMSATPGARPDLRELAAINEKYGLT